MLHPRSLGQLQTLPVLEPLALDAELRWIVQLFRSFADLINRSLALRGEVESRLIAGDGEDALSCLDQMETEVGPSLCVVATRLAALQITRGLEAQKDEYNRIRNLSVQPNTKFFAYWWSVRAEERSSWQNFERDFDKRLRAWEIPEGLRAFVAFHILGRIPADGDEQLLLSSSITGTALDLYEAFVATATEAVVEGRTTRAAFVAACSEVGGFIEDGRLQKLLFLSGDTGVANSFAPAPTAIRDAAFAPTKGSMAARISDVGELFHVEDGSQTSARGNLPERIAHAEEQTQTAGSLEQGLAELRKLAAMFDHLPLGKFIRARTSVHRSTDMLETQSAKRLFAVTEPMEPESLSALSSDQLNALQNQMSGGIPTGPYWLWNRALAGQLRLDQIGHNISAVAIARLQLIEALRGTNSEDVLAAASELNHVIGEVSELSIRAEIEATESLHGIEAALAKTVDYLLSRSELATWMPLQWLASEAQSGSVVPTNIDVALILDFAAKFADPKLGPPRTYAAEDYLISRSVSAPSDLCETIPPEQASPRECYFLGEVCVPASLRTSTIFENERELENDRIATCRWLIQADPKHAERFEEEARELARSRHISLGIQALQGSKLSIDREALLRWAERNVAEDFQRYMDLLEKGIFVPDEKFRNSVYAALEGGTEAPTVLEIPDNEAAALFARMTGRLLREFALHPEHGLDAYMSLRIRHGTLSGHLRGPVEREHLVTRTDRSGRYLPNDYWMERLGDELDYEALELVSDTLEALSRSLDQLITRLTQDLIQIRREEKPNGMIKVDPSQTVLALMIAETLPGQSFEDFFVKSEDTFWSLVQVNEEQIQQSLGEMKTETGRLFDRTEEGIRAIAGEGAGALKDALLRARASALAGIDQIGEWLAPPTTPASLLLSVEELIRVSLAVISGFYQDFAPDVQFELGELPALSGVVRLFSDIFFIIFENVLKYSGNEVDPRIRIKAWIEGDYLKFRIENSVEKVSEEDVRRIASAKQRIEYGSFRRAMRGEGGTGLPKLAKVIGLGSGGGDLSFDLTDDRKNFVVEFSLRKIDVAQSTEEQS